MPFLPVVSVDLIIWSGAAARKPLFFSAGASIGRSRGRDMVTPVPGPPVPEAPWQAAQFFSYSVLPLVIPLGLNFGIMGAADITLNAATAMIASVAIGIGVDYSIHFLSRFRHEKKKGVDLERALDISIKTSGRGILYNAMAVSSGFLVFVPSRFVPLAHTGFLVALVMITSAVATLTVLPAALKILRFKKRSWTEKAAIPMGRASEV